MDRGKQTVAAFIDPILTHKQWQIRGGQHQPARGFNQVDLGDIMFNIIHSDRQL